MISRHDQAAGAVHVLHALWSQLIAEASATPDVECCGLLAASDGGISALWAARQGAPRASTYEIVPAELFSLFRRMRDERLEHLGIYHSHPRGDNSPSESDVALAYYPDAAYFIISPRPDAPRPVRAFRIADGRWS